MRPLSAIGFAATLTVLAGCNSSPTTPAAPVLPWTQEQLNATAGKFEMKQGENKKPNELPLQFVDMSGKAVDLSSYRGQKNVVLVVVKGLPQQFNGQFCPGCLAQVNSLTASYPEFQKRNAEVVMVFPGPPEAHKQFLREGLVTDAEGGSKVPFPLVSDPNPDLKAVKALGIDGDWARPSTYILNKSGDVVFAYVGPKGTTYDRPSVKALLDQLDKLNGVP